MCGIVGICASSSIKSREWLAVANNTIVHRGPDDSGEWWSVDGKVGLAHRRLSILDLSPLGHQPMHYDLNGSTIVFNGEIYNFQALRKQLLSKGYQFYSASDTEVILAAYNEWGTDCLEKFEGMYAFALYDPKKQQVLLARDRAGEKPLFYSIFEGNMYFASELKALLSRNDAPRKINEVAMDCYLHMGHIPGDLCILKGYNKLPAAHAMLFDLNSSETHIWKYWQIPQFIGQFHTPTLESELVQELDFLLNEAVGRQLVADVPVGILLSGGVDSSLITAMAARNSDHIKTFTVGFPKFGGLDESKFAKKISDYFVTEHHELNVESISPDLVFTLAKQFDEPMVDSSMIPTYLVSNLVSKHCKVVLGGDGSDELFGGYAHYKRLVDFKGNYGFVPQKVLNLISCGAEKLTPAGMKYRNLMIGLGADLNKSLPLTLTYGFDATTRRNLMKPHGPWNTASEEIHRSRIPVQDGLLQRATRMDFTNYLAEDILVKVDRTSMLNSLEVRAPFLDRALVEFAFSKVPAYLKVAGLKKKILPKKLTETLLPADFDRTRKQGFSIPIDDWMRNGPLRELTYDLLLANDCLFDRSTIQKLLTGHDKGRANGEKLFALVLFELWRKEYKTYL